MTQETTPLSKLGVTDLRKIGKVAGLKGITKKDAPAIITMLEELDESVVAKAYVSVMDSKKSAKTESAPAPTEGESGGAEFPYASSEDVPNGAYCQCSEPIPLGEDGTLKITECSKCGLNFVSGNVDFSTTHGTHRIAHTIGKKPTLCPLDGEPLDEAAETSATETATTETSSASASSTTHTDGDITASFENGVLSYDNGEVEFTVLKSDIDKAVEEFSKTEKGKAKPTHAQVRSIELPCIEGCSGTYKTWSPQARMLLQVIEGIETKGKLPYIKAVHPTHPDCMQLWERSHTKMLASSRDEEAATPENDDAAKAMRERPWKIVDGRAYHDDGSGHSFSFEVAEAENAANGVIAFSYKCTGCRKKMRFYADRAVQAAKACVAGAESNTFSHLGSFCKDECKRKFFAQLQEEAAKAEATDDAADEPVIEADKEASSRITRDRVDELKAEAEAAEADDAAKASEAPEPAISEPDALLEPAEVVAAMSDESARLESVARDAFAEAAASEPAPSWVAQTAGAPAPEAWGPESQPTPRTASPAPATDATAQIITAIGGLVTGVPRHQVDIAAILKALPVNTQPSIPEIMKAVAEITEKAQAGAQAGMTTLADVAKTQSEQLGRNADTANALAQGVVNKLLEDRSGLTAAIQALPDRIRQELGDLGRTPEARTPAGPYSVADPTSQAQPTAQN